MIKNDYLNLEKINRVFLFLLIFFGILLVSSASALESQRLYGSSFYMVRNHIISILIGGFLYFFIKSFIKFEFLLSNLKYLSIGMVGILFILFSYGETIFGSNRWLDLGIIRFQPSEFAKPLVFLWVAKEVSEFDKNQPLAKQLLKIAFIPALITLLVLFQPDFGTAATIVFVVLMQLFVSRIKLIVPIISSVISFLLGYQILLSQGYRSKRFQVWIEGVCDRGEELLGACYQVHQSRIAISSGGLLGLGPGTSRSRWGSLPSSYSDFISAIIGEEYGFIGYIIFLIILLTFIFTLYLMGINKDNEVKKVFIFGLASWILVQSVLNLGATVYLLPVTGIVLPFISYGGSSMASLFISLGIIKMRHE